jgi:uncharacterized protein YndB with AHSA1/START domain
MSDTDLVLHRIFDAPRPLVYRAFVDPDQLAQWFGPVGWSVPRETVSIDARAGGEQRFTMVNDDDPAHTSPVDTTFTEVVEGELLVGETAAEGGRPALRLRVEFHDEPGGRTRIVLTQGPYPPGWLSGASQGWESSFTKLDKLF